MRQHRSVAKGTHHVLFFEVYDTAAAFDAHRQIEHFKSYQVATKDIGRQSQGQSVHFGRDEQ
jgi:quinol monooxygenase YgiN